MRGWHYLPAVGWGTLFCEVRVSAILGPVDSLVIRRPGPSDVPGIKALIDAAVLEGMVLPRSLDTIWSSLDDFFVCIDQRGVGGCCALHVDSPALAEVRSLVVREDLRGHGIGVRLLHACIEECVRLHVPRIYALSRRPQFFAEQGFHAVNRSTLPEKEVRDCVRCFAYRRCEAVAMVRDLPPASVIK